MEYTLPALLLIQSCVIQGLFFDTMMSDCYGIPFMCNLQKKGDNYNQDNTSPFMAASLTETGDSNNINNHQSVSNPASMSQHLSFNNGQSMTTEVSHNQEAVRNPFFQTQQNMVSGGLASSMHSIGHSTNYNTGDFRRIYDFFQCPKCIMNYDIIRYEGGH
ncbi:uncharacterized protein LOC117315276 [Pecten maximus]|uniref:uncharacterized protein LOC117315276 n=1 Tax=Pecten maximus TaxID=6579 RepID=UPI0014583184|nr:uncharacterized protein LOC117315276 [Pecten maximus]